MKTEADTGCLVTWIRYRVSSHMDQIKGVKSHETNTRCLTHEIVTGCPVTWNRYRMSSQMEHILGVKSHGTETGCQVTWNRY